MTEGGADYRAHTSEIGSAKEVAVSSQTEAVAGFLRGKVGFVGTEVITQGDSEGKGRILVTVPDVPAGQTASVFRFHDNRDIRQFHEMARAADGLQMDMKVGEVAGTLQTFGIDKFNVGSYEDFQDYQFLAGIAESLGRNPAIQKWDRKGLDR